MSYRNIIHQILSQSIAAYKAGSIDRYQMQHTQARCKTLFRKLRHREEYRIRRFHFETYLRERFLPLRRCFETGTVVAFDVGFQPYSTNSVVNIPRLTEEVGICQHRQGQTHTVTYRHHSRAERNKEALYGPIVYADLPEILARAKAAYEGADAVVFHDDREDAPRLSIDPSRCVDTVKLERIFSQCRRDPSLIEVCEEYRPDLGRNECHESGNDAYRTLMVAKAMCERFNGSVQQIMADHLRSERKSLAAINRNSERFIKSNERLRRKRLVHQLTGNL